MDAETHVYFPRTGAEPSKFVLVRLYRDGGRPMAERSLAGPSLTGPSLTGLAAAGDGEAHATGEPHAVLRDARDQAGLGGLDLKIELDGVEWDPALGSLVAAQ